MHSDFKELLSIFNAHRVKYLMRFPSTRSLGRPALRNPARFFACAGNLSASIFSPQFPVWSLMPHGSVDQMRKA